MAPTKVVLMAKARQLGVPEYRKLSEDELRSAIKRAEGTPATRPAKGKAAPAKGKASPNGATKPAKGKVKTKATPAKGKATVTRKSTSKSAPAKSKAKKSTPKAKASQGAKVKRPTAGRVTSTGKLRKGESGTRAPLGSKINWNRETNVGRRGKRKDVLDALREFKGDKASVHKKLRRKADKWYPDGGNLGSSEAMLRWLIGRVAFDYALKSGQHESAQRAAYGTSKRPQDVKRREERVATRKPARSRRSAAKGTRKASATKASSRKATGTRKRTAARKGR